MWPVVHGSAWLSVLGMRSSPAISLFLVTGSDSFLLLPVGVLGCVV